MNKSYGKTWSPYALHVSSINAPELLTVTGGILEMYEHRLFYKGTGKALP